MEALKVVQQESYVLGSAAAPRFEVRLANEWELEDVYRLRYRVFFEELGAHTDEAEKIKMDIDAYDRFCDHLIVLHQGSIIGTYRLLPLQRLPSRLAPCYSQNEFDVADIRAYFDDSILELGRTCVDPKFRNGTVATLLWSGIADYLKTNKFQALFGCVSIHGASHFEAQEISRYFNTVGRWHPNIRANVTSTFSMPKSTEQSTTQQSSLLANKIPSLFNGYLSLGAKVCGGPAYDEEFHCHDFFIVLETHEISPKHLKFLQRMGQLSARNSSQRC